MFVACKYNNQTTNSWHVRVSPCIVMCWVLRALARGERRVQEVVEALAVLEPAVHQQQVTERVRQVAHCAALRQPATQGEADE